MAARPLIGCSTAPVVSALSFEMSVIEDATRGIDASGSLGRAGAELSSAGGKRT
jgi:hypothetical protein